MHYKNITLPNGEMMNTYCGKTTCENCNHKKVFEYPWKVPNKERRDEKESLEIEYCECFSLWAKPYEIDTLLPQPLEYDEEKNCLRHEKCIRSEIVTYERKEDDNEEPV